MFQCSILFHNCPLQQHSRPTDASSSLPCNLQHGGWFLLTTKNIIAKNIFCFFYRCLQHLLHRKFICKGEGFPNYLLYHLGGIHLCLSPDVAWKMSFDCQPPKTWLVGYFITLNIISFSQDDWIHLPDVPQQWDFKESALGHHGNLHSGGGPSQLLVHLVAVQDHLLWCWGGWAWRLPWSLW